MLRLQVAVEAESPKHLVATLNALASQIHDGRTEGSVTRDRGRGWFQVERLGVVAAAAALAAEETAGVGEVPPAEPYAPPIPDPEVPPEPPEDPLGPAEPPPADSVLHVETEDVPPEPVADVEPVAGPADVETLEPEP